MADTADITAAEMGRRSNRRERARLGEEAYRATRRERGRLGGLAPHRRSAPKPRMPQDAPGSPPSP